jgi:very-short-patch-repair endonuclease
MAVNAVREPHRRSALKRKLARELRANTATAERKLWRLLRNKQFAGLKFRRQQPIGPLYRRLLLFNCKAGH